MRQFYASQVRFKLTETFSSRRDVVQCLEELHRVGFHCEQVSRSSFGELVMGILDFSHSEPFVACVPSYADVCIGILGVKEMPFDEGHD